MEAGERPRGSDVPPPGEAIHLPGPSYLPVLTALGIAIALVGIVIAWYLVVIGGVIALIAIGRWIRETREEISELPVEHG
jgi:cytochrome c oxidase subunit IV